uniref:Uncharacterized protein n=1 Tax=viral metagenome TaxID=1070528 RepID=A0A6M3J416_9ZZZZ
MTVEPIRTIYPFAEVFEISTNGTTAVDVWDIPINTIITMVLARVKVAGAGSGGNLIVGDDDDDDGFILAANLCGATVATIYGDAVAERGAYLEAGATGTHAGSWKVYPAAGKELKIDCSVDMTTEATIELFVFGYSYHV